jgi:hypothetical protein
MGSRSVRGRRTDPPELYRRDDILPRSLHLPVGVTDGSATENLNEIGVRLWTYWLGRAESSGSELPGRRRIALSVNASDSSGVITDELPFAGCRR